MFRCLALVAAGLMVGAGAGAATDLPAYSVTDLKALGIWPEAMNNRGEIVGHGIPLETGHYRTFLFAAGSVTELRPPDAPERSIYRRLINDAGHVVLESGIDAWLFDGNGYRKIEMQPPAPSGFDVSGTYVRDINIRDQIVGTANYASVSNSGVDTRAWLNDRGDVRDLGSLVPACADATMIFADDINDQGDVTIRCNGTSGVIGGALLRDGTWREVAECRYSPWASCRALYINNARTILVDGYVFGPSYVIDDAGTYAIGPICDLGSLGCPANPSWLNNRSEVIGRTGSRYPQAFLWMQGVTLDISPPDSKNSDASKANDGGIVVGKYWTEAGKIRPFIHAAGTSTDLAELRGVGTALDLALSDSNDLVVDINGAGQILAVSEWRAQSVSGYKVLNGAHLLTPIVPTVSLLASAIQARVGTPVTLTWAATNANYCVATGGVTGDGWAGERAISGQATVSASAPATVQYSLRCSAGPVSGESSASVVYSLNPPTVSLAATPAESRLGKSVTLNWVAKYADACVATGGRPGDGWTGALPTTGQKSVMGVEAGTVQYGVRCSAGGASSEALASVAFKRKSGGGGYVDVLVVLGLAGLGLSRRRRSIWG